MKLKARENISWYLLMFLPIIGTLIFSVIPLVNTFSDSITGPTGNFVGLTNYKILFNDIEFKQGIGNTFFMGVLAVILNIPLAFLVANMINNIVKAKSFYKTMLLLPIIMSMVTVALLFKFIFSADPNSVANSFIRIFGMEAQGWFNNPETSRQMVVLMNVWKNLGYNVILFLAGLQTLPHELYEAAEVDGAGEFHKWVHITIPCMKNSFVFVFINTCINVLKRFSDVYAISGEFGDPAGSLHTIMLYIYRKSFSTRFSKDLGAASSASIILFLLIIVITIINMVSTEERGFKKKHRAKREGR